MVQSHPVYGSASLSVRSGKTYRTLTLVATDGAVVGATRVPTASDIRYERVHTIDTAPMHSYEQSRDLFL